MGQWFGIIPVYTGTLVVILTVLYVWIMEDLKYFLLLQNDLDFISTAIIFSTWECRVQQKSSLTL